MVNPMVIKKKRKTKRLNPFNNSLQLKPNLNGTQTKLLDNSKVIPATD